MYIVFMFEFLLLYYLNGVLKDLYNLTSALSSCLTFFKSHISHNLK